MKRHPTATARRLESDPRPGDADRRWSESAFLMLAAALVFAALAPLAQATPFSWEAKVDDEIITGYDVEQRARLLKFETRSENDAGLRKEAREQLIEEALKSREAARRGVELKQGALEDALKRVSRGAPERYLAELESFGVERATVKRRLTVALSWNALLRKDHLRKIEPSEAEIETELAAAKASPGGPPKYRISRIFVANGDASVKQTARRAESARKAITSCSNIEAKAKPFGRVDTRNLTAQQLQRMGMPDPTVKRLLALSNGQSLRPLRSPQGFHVFVNCGRGAGGAAPSADSVTSALTNRKAEFVSQSLVADLRRDALIEIAR